MKINIKVSYKLISTLWASRMPTRCYYHSCWAWSSIFKVLKVISLQYLYNISKKEEVFISWDYFFMEVARYVQSTQNRKLVIFLQRVLQLLLCSIVMQNIQIFYGGPAMFIVTYLFPCTARLEIFCLKTAIQ